MCHFKDLHLMKRKKASNHSKKMPTVNPFFEQITIYTKQIYY